MVGQSPGEGRLVRRLGTGHAVTLGLAAMLGAGVFTVFAPAARAAGTGLLVGLAIAAVVATCNATSSAQLAAQYPESGGTYVYGRRRLGPWSGFLAGWAFLIGKTASCAAMALTVGHYLAPAPYREAVAVAAVLTMGLANYLGVTRTATVARAGVTLVIAALVVVVIAAFASPNAASAPSTAPTAYGVLQAAGLLFFAFAGYARIATMGEEVRRPEQTIPRAITIALALTLILYLAVALALFHVLGPAGVAGSTAPLAEAATESRWPHLDIVARLGAIAGALGALLALMAGIGRTALAMARHDDLPRWLAAVHPHRSVPHRAELLLATVVSAIVLTTDVRSAIGFSSFGVLLYYAVANAAAFTQSPERRRYPRGLQVLGLLGCLVLCVTLPWRSILAGTGVLVVGVAYRLLRKRRRRAAR